MSQSQQTLAAALSTEDVTTQNASNTRRENLSPNTTQDATAEATSRKDVAADQPGQKKKQPAAELSPKELHDSSEPIKHNGPKESVGSKTKQLSQTQSLHPTKATETLLAPLTKDSPFISPKLQDDPYHPSKKDLAPPPTSGTTPPADLKPALDRDGKTPVPSPAAGCPLAPMEEEHSLDMHDGCLTYISMNETLPPVMVSTPWTGPSPSPKPTDQAQKQTERSLASDLQFVGASLPMELSQNQESSSSAPTSSADPSLTPERLGQLVAESPGLRPAPELCFLERKAHDDEAHEAIFGPCPEPMDLVEPNVVTPNMTPETPVESKSGIEQSHGVANIDDNSNRPEALIGTQTGETGGQDREKCEKSYTGEHSQPPDVAAKLLLTLASEENSSKENVSQSESKEAVPEKMDDEEMDPHQKGKPVGPAATGNENDPSEWLNCNQKGVSLSTPSLRKRTRKSSVCRSFAKKVKVNNTEKVKGTSTDLKVIITGVKAMPRHKMMIEKIGGLFLENIENASEATHVIAGDNGMPLRRTPKLMIALCHTSNVVGMDWLVQSAMAHQALDCGEFLLLRDEAAEKKYEFSMRDTLENGDKLRLKQKYVLSGWYFYFCPGVAGNKAPPESELRLIVDAAGGKWLPSLAASKLDNVDASSILVVTSDPATKEQTSMQDIDTILQQGARTVTTSWLFHCMIKQEFTGLQ